MALRLKQKGIERVRPLAGGLNAWRERGYPVEADPSPEGLAGNAATSFPTPAP